MALAAPVTTRVARHYLWLLSFYQSLQDYGSGKHDGEHREAEYWRQAGAYHVPSTRLFSQHTVILHTTGGTRLDLFSDPFEFLTILSAVCPW